MRQQSRILFTGISGFLGWHFAKNVADGWDVHGIANRHPEDVGRIKVHQVDLTDYASMNATIERINPDAIIHAAAMSGPNRCEENPKDSYAINVEATRKLAGLCAERAIPFVFTSTDLVFDGEHAPYSEEDEPNPINIYGEHKARAEKLVLQQYPEALIVRLPLMFGDPGPVASNFYQFMLEQLSAGKELKLFADEYRSMLSGAEAARGLVHLLGSHTGIVHLGGPESVSRFEFGLRLAGIFGFDPAQISPVSSQIVATGAPRPKDVTLTNSRAWNMGFEPISLESQLEECWSVYANQD